MIPDDLKARIEHLRDIRRRAGAYGDFGNIRTEGYGTHIVSDAIKYQDKDRFELVADNLYTEDANWFVAATTDALPIIDELLALLEEK